MRIGDKMQSITNGLATEVTTFRVKTWSIREQRVLVSLTGSCKKTDTEHRCFSGHRDRPKVNNYPETGLNLN